MGETDRESIGGLMFLITRGGVAVVDDLVYKNKMYDKANIRSIEISNVKFSIHIIPGGHLFGILY
jgi:hypothetical protein|tara:strand:- start:453 stop:647 length:195 start_codon:yes stop_codon:yes gene_type:complete